MEINAIYIDIGNSMLAVLAVLAMLLSRATVAIIAISHVP